MKGKIASRGMVAQYGLAAGVFFAFVSVIGVALAPEEESPLAAIRLDPAEGLVVMGQPFEVKIMVDASTPVNVFKGELRFDPAVLRVASIDYNVSIAELWAELPWYANGEGTLNFIGGTTKEGGFLGSGALMTVRFEPLGLGDTKLTLIDSRILAHDGFGSDVPVRSPIDALFTVEPPIIDAQTIAASPSTPAHIAVVRSGRSTDLNGDGLQTIADVSIFMTGLLTQNLDYDLTGDGKVSAADLSMILSAK